MVNYWEQFDSDGRWPKNPEAYNTLAKVMLKQLLWWAWALKKARAEQPYPG